MTTVTHASLTGADLHEPKGCATAANGQVYVANGSGSGVWTAASAIITNQAFSTGDAKLTYKTTADSGWVLCDDGTIGDGSSGATTRANADTSALFTLLWNLPVLLTVSGGRGASAAVDYAAHKTIALPKTLGRAIFIAGSGAGLTTRTLAGTAGAETTTLVAGNIPTLASTGSNSISVTSASSGVMQSAGAIVDTTTGTSGVNFSAGAYQQTTRSAITSSGTNTINVTYTNASPAGVAVIPPAAFLNIMIKL